MTHVVEINDIHELSHYRLLWDLLLSQTRGGSFFQSLAWLETYWRHFGQRQRLRVLIVYSGDEPVGILPLTETRERTRVGTTRVLTYPLHDWGSFYGPVGPNPTATLYAALRHVRRTPRRWDMLDLRWIGHEGCDNSRVAVAMQAAGLPARHSVWKEIAVVEMTGDWERYLASRSSKFRNNLRRCQKRVEELGGVEFQRYRPGGVKEGDADPRWDDYDQCVALAGRTWQGSSQTGTTLSHDAVRDFFRDSHELAARAGALDLALVKRHGEVIAFGYNYHFGGYVSGLRMGHDPQFEKAGLGNVLYASSFTDSFRRGDTLFDMGPGYLDIKRHWLTSIKESYRCTHYAPTRPRAQLLRLKHWLGDRWTSSFGRSADAKARPA